MEGAPDHLIVLVHGNNGHADDWSRVAERLRALFGETATVLRSTANQASTKRGVAVGGAALAQEVITAVRRLMRSEDDEGAATGRRVLRFSMLGHSLGGLYIRYALALLARDPLARPVEAGGRLDWRSVAFLCSPHLGSRRPGGTLVKGAWRLAVHGVVHSLYGPTGADLMLGAPTAGNGEAAAEVDGGGVDAPVLLRMSHPESPWARALASFAHRTFVAITDGDMSVPYCAAAVRGDNPHPRCSLWAGQSSWRIAQHAGFCEPLRATLDRFASLAESRVALAPDGARDADVASADAAGGAGGADPAGGADAGGAHWCASQRDEPEAEAWAPRSAESLREAAGVLVPDERSEVEYPRGVVDWITGVARPFRQIDIEVALHNASLLGCVHNFPIGKMQLGELAPLSEQWVDVLCGIVWHDHAHARPDRPASNSDRGRAGEGGAE